MSDYIKREEAAKILLQRREFAENQDWTQEVDLMELLCERLDELPAADVVERKKGEWIVRPREEYQTFDECVCSECGVVEYFNLGWKKFNYCPNCGADMRGAE